MNGDGSDTDQLIQDNDEHVEEEDAFRNDSSEEDEGRQNVQEHEPNTRSRGCIVFLKKIPLAGFVLVLLACFAMTAAGIIVKVMNHVDTFVLTGYRNCVIFLCSVIRLAFLRINPEPRGKVKYLILRGILLTGYSSGLYYSFRYLPLGDVRTLTSAQPVLVTWCACMLLSEPCGLFDIFSLVSTIVGLILVTHPPFIFGDNDGTIYNLQYYIAAGMALFGTVCQSFGFIITRSLKQYDFSILTAWMGLVGFIPPLLISLAMGTFSLPSARDTPFVIMIGVLSFLGQSLMTLALQVQETGTVALVRKADDILLAFFIQIVYFKNMPDALAIIGSVIITITVLLTGARKIMDSRAQSSLIRYNGHHGVNSSSENPPIQRSVHIKWTQTVKSQIANEHDRMLEILLL